MTKLHKIGSKNTTQDIVVSSLNVPVFCVLTSLNINDIVEHERSKKYKIEKEKQMKRLPKNTEEISYYRNKKKEVVTSLVYPCGCTVDITWEDIEMGKTKNVEIDYLCDEHDATKPFKSLKTFLN